MYDTISATEFTDFLYNLAQNIAFSKTAIRTSQHVGLDVYVYHKIRSKDLLAVLNKLGLCISYTDLQRILSSVAVEVRKKSTDGVLIPSNIAPQKFINMQLITLVFQNVLWMDLACMLPVW